MKAAIALLLVWPWAAVAQDPPERVKLEVEGDTAIVVRALPFKINAPKGFSFYAWRYDFTKIRALEGNASLEIFEMPGGDHSFQVKMLKQEIVDGPDGSPVIKNTTLVGYIIIRNGTKPEPDPDPDPDPNPSKPLSRIVIVEESAQRIPELQQLYVKLRQQLTYPLIITDKDSNQQELQAAIQEGTKHSLPAVVFYDEDDKVLYSGSAPLGFNEFMSLVEDFE